MDGVGAPLQSSDDLAPALASDALEWQARLIVVGRGAGLVHFHELVQPAHSALDLAGTGSRNCPAPQASTMWRLSPRPW
jgi:hypothetical protein